MKTLHLSIIVVACIGVASVILNFASYHPTPITKENNFGINALVVHQHIGTGCPTENCPYPEHYLKINSKFHGEFLVGYNICDENSCVKKDGIAISLPVVDVLHPDYQKLQLPDNLPWKDGDSVNIQVKVLNGFISDSAFTLDPSHDPKIWVDLGKSEIVRSS